MRVRAVILAAALMLAPLGAQAADLVVWWEKGAYAQEDAAVEEIVAAFEQKTSKDVALTFYEENDIVAKVVAVLNGGQLPDFAFGQWFAQYIGDWAFDDRLVDLSHAVGTYSDLFDPEVLKYAMWLNAKTGQQALYGLPVARSADHIHIWKSLLERAGLTLKDVPKEWEAFWSFWCDRAQPAIRNALGRNDVWGVGLTMSVEAYDTWINFRHFMIAYGADYVTPDGRLVIDDPKIRQRLVKAIGSYTAFYRKGCTPPDAVAWGPLDNNKQFQAQTVVMAPNETLSAVNALKYERPEDYYKNAVTMEWPFGPTGEVFATPGNVFPAVVFKGGSNVGVAEDFVRFLVGEGWLGHYLNFSGERFLPTISALLEQSFWLDPGDPHRMAAVMQISSRPLAYNYAGASGDRRHDRVEQEHVWAKAIHHIVTEDVTPEQAVDEAIARIKQLLSE